MQTSSTYKINQQAQPFRVKFGTLNFDNLLRATPMPRPRHFEWIVFIQLLTALFLPPFSAFSSAILVQSSLVCYVCIFSYFAIVGASNSSPQPPVFSARFLWKTKWGRISFSNFNFVQYSHVSSPDLIFLHNKLAHIFALLFVKCHQTNFPR